ncbi:hypothetical protein [Vibrio marisflavi]|uniref:hypothetical protein n=1 Tax=Vibrio marisflavi TaxID=1216040 RepID=UPI001F2E1352|nr:hypothetical protein [Vibrio marisflavi]
MEIAARIGAIEHSPNFLSFSATKLDILHLATILNKTKGKALYCPRMVIDAGNIGQV